MKRAKTTGVIFVALCFAAGSLMVWTDRSQAASDRGNALVEEILQLIEAAEKARAADPKFLNELRQALEDYQGPKFVELMKDDFRDGNFSHNPRWSEFKGEYSVDRNHGLHSLVPKPMTSQDAPLVERLNILEAKRADKGRYTMVQSETLANSPYTNER